MSGSQGRRDKAHIAWRNYFRSNNVPCHECGQPATIADHDPPLSTGQWQGRYLPHCQRCSCKQGAQITNSKHRKPSRTW